MKNTVIVIFTVLISIFSASAQSVYPFDVKIVGNGENKILLIPGFACSGNVWDATSKQLENRYECHILTMSGFAGVKPTIEPDLNQWIKSIEEYISQHQLNRPIIIGHSLGGLMAIMLAADKPQLVSKMVIVDALPCLAALRNPNFTSTMNPDCESYIDYFVKMDSSAFFNSQKLSVSSMVTNSEIVREVLHWTLQSDKKTMGKIYCQFSNTDMRERISTITCPTLILLESSFAQMKPSIESQYKKLKSASFEYADKGLHFIMFDDEVWFMNKIKTFLR